MKCTSISLKAYPRKNHFEYFRSLAYPYVGVTVNVDITDWINVIKSKKYPFFHSFLYAITRAANFVPEFRQRIKDDGIIEYDKCASSYAVALADDTYCYCNVECKLPFDEFIAYARARQEEAIRSASIDDNEDILSLYFISSLPWLTYTNIIQPVTIPADSNPRISWGKYYKDSEKVLIPVSVLCHHALVDGIHISRFYNNLRMQLDAACHEINEA